MSRVLVLLLWAGLPACELADADGDGVPVNEDCNDQDPDQQRPLTLFVDADGDGWGGPTTEVGCLGNEWLVDNTSDCDDDDSGVHPLGTEIGCDGRDNDCNDRTPDGPAVSGNATWSTVQAALDAAQAPDFIELCASTIHEALRIERPVTLVGAGPELTVIDASGLQAPVIEVNAQTTLRGMTLTGGSGGSVDDDSALRAGGGLLAVGGDLLLIEDCSIRGNTADIGGGIAALGTTPTFVWNTTIDDNRADLGGGLYVSGPISFELRDSLVLSNFAETGGGVWLQGAMSLLTTRIESNEAAFGGGAHLSKATAGESALFAVGSTLFANVASSGGGVHGQGLLQELTVEGNVAERGGGVWADGTLRVVGGDIVDNLAINGDGGGIVGPADAWLVLEGTALVGNSATDGGGAIALPNAALSALDTRLEDNTAQRGAGLYAHGPICGGCTRTVVETVFTGNVATETGGAVHHACGGTLTLQNTTLDDNEAVDGAAIFVEDAHAALQNSLVIAHAAGAADGAAARLQQGQCAETATRITATDATFAGNSPHDLNVDTLGPVEPAPSFDCTLTDVGAVCQ